MESVMLMMKDSVCKLQRELESVKTNSTELNSEFSNIHTDLAQVQGKKMLKKTYIGAHKSTQRRVQKYQYDTSSYR